MKNLFILLITATFTLTTGAQSIKVKSIKKVPLEQEAHFPSFGRSSNELFFTGRNYKGLSLYNLKSKEKTVLSLENAAGSDYKVDEDNKLSYTTKSFQNGRQEIQSKEITLEPLKEGFWIFKKTPEPIKINNITAKVDGKKINIFENKTQIRSIAPFEDVYYIWTSVSPDEKHVLFTVPVKGTFVCDLHGNIVHELGYINSPQWMGNDWVIGMNDKDNGHIVTSSDIISVHLPSKKQFNLTEKIEEIAIYPKVSPENDKIVFQGKKGEINIISIKIRK